MNRSLLTAIVALTLGMPAAAEDICPCIPITHVWTVKSCDTWDCAAAEFNISSGSADTVVMPTGSTDMKWVVLQRVASGTTTSADRTFTIENYDGWPDASTRFGTLDPSVRPMILSTPDGRFVVLSRKEPEPRRRAAGH